MDKHSLSEIQLLRSQYRDLVELIARLRRDLSFETQEGEKFKLEKRLEDEEIRKEIIKDKLTEIEEEIKRELIIYVSYSRDDGGTVSERVTKELKNEGYTVERGREFNPYDGLPQEYRQKIMDSTHVLVCITEKADQAISALQLELSYSLENNKNIIPLFFPNGNKPVQIFRYKEVNFNEWQTGLKQLTNALSTPSRSEIKKVIDNRDMELEYLQKITQEFDIWRSLYTEMTFSGKIKESKIKLKPAAATLLERNVQISKTAKISHRFEDDPSDMVTLETFEDLIETVTKYRRVAIIGDPGSGKTTTLHRMLYEFASKAVKHQEQLIPIFVRLGEYSGGDFQSFLESSFNGFSISDYLPNRVIVMLDGLNEMPLGLVKNVEDWINHNPATFIIVSCRKLEYLERKLPLHRMDISPLRITQIFKFINNFFVEEDDTEHLFWALAGKSTFEAWQWFINENPNSSFENFWFGVTEHVRSYEDQKSVLKQIQDDIRERNTLPGLLGLVSNPYLLYAVIRIFYQNEKPPQNRGELFTQFVSQLLENKEKSKPKFDISQLILRNAMGKLSYRMQIERKGTSVSKKWVIEILRENFPEQNAEDLLLMAIGCGLLELRETDEAVFVRFSHQLLQEYFAAYEMDEDIKRGVLAQKFWPNEKWWEPTGWEETAMLLAGIQGDATKIVEWLAPIHPTLAFFCATESGVPCDSNALKLLFEPSPGARISPIARAAWGKQLSQIGDNRIGVGLGSNGIPSIVWCEVPPGEFVMGGDPSLEAFGISWDGGAFEIPYRYWVAKYLTTYVQFSAFVREGYDNINYWTQAGWRWKGNQHNPRMWDDKNFHFDNHPLVGVTWYEAYAYTKWLDEKLHKVGIDGINYLPEEWEIRLPTEAEWEKTVRFPDGRLYPWGNSYISGYANVDETYENAVCGPYALRRTTAVGMYDHILSNSGAMDLCGNVWEWNLSKWKKNYDFSENTDPEGTEHRGVRGGSWYNSFLFGSAAAHDCLDADLGVNDVGFRIILSPKSVLSPHPLEASNPIKSGMTLKVFVAGLINSGKTEFIKTVSDLPQVSVEKKIVPNEKIINMDYGRVPIYQNMIYLYAPAEEVDYRYIWENLYSEMNASILLIDCSDSGAMRESIFLHKTLKDKKLPHIIVATKADYQNSLSKEEIVKLMGLSDTDKVILCNARNTESAKQGIITLHELMSSY